MTPDERNQRKKMLLVEGMMHRLEIMHTLHQVRNQAQANVVLGKLPGILAFIARRNAAPLIAAAAPLVFGKSGLSRLLRRLLFMAGAGAGIAALLRHWRSRQEEE